MTSQIDQMAVIAIQSELDSCFKMILHVLAEAMDQTHTGFRSDVFRAYLTVVESHESVIRLDISSVHVEGLEVKRA